MSRPHRPLRYHATTATGTSYDISFPLHAETGDRERTACLLDALLETITEQVEQRPGMTNGDVMQALAMAFAIRAGMIAGAPRASGLLAAELLETALDAMATARTRSLPAGHG